MRFSRILNIHRCCFFSCPFGSTHGSHFNLSLFVSCARMHCLRFYSRDHPIDWIYWRNSNKNYNLQNRTWFMSKKLDFAHCSSDVYPVKSAKTLDVEERQTHESDDTNGESNEMFRNIDRSSHRENNSQNTLIKRSHRVISQVANSNKQTESDLKSHSHMKDGEAMTN